jgi:5-methylcytosine-specific restriction endonuclease McrA
MVLADIWHLAGDGETDARWRLVETAWATGLNPGLVAPIEYDEDNQTLFTMRKLRRRNVSGVVPSLSGYQDGRCAYCQQAMYQRGIGKPIVEHVLPLVLRRERWEGPPLDAVWNLVLSCQPCNSDKWGRAPHENWMPWLQQRNDDLIASHHPLRQTLMAQTGNTAAVRAATLRAAYRLATERLPATWTPLRGL